MINLYQMEIYVALITLCKPISKDFPSMQISVTHFYSKSKYKNRRETGGAGEMEVGGNVSLALFHKFEKRVLILGKNALIWVIYGLHFSFKMECLRVSRRKNRRFFPVQPFFLCRVVHDCLSKRPYSKKPPLPRKITGYAPEESLKFKVQWYQNCLNWK